MISSKILRFFSTAALVVGFSTAAHAQATRTWVSGVGDDANPCSRTAPCKTFAGAISKTAPSGEINVLDPGGFGAVTITKSITIRSDHIQAGVLVSGTNGVVVSAGASDTIVLEGLDIEGLGTGLNGLQILSSSSVIIRRSSIHHFTGNGVNLVGTANAKVLVQDCVISLNGGGVNVQGAGGVTNNAVIDHTTIDTHTNFAVQAAQGGAAFLSASNLIGSGTKLVISGTGTVTSYGNNVIRGAGAPPTTTLPLQ
jgi:Right handed beta helix region